MRTLIMFSDVRPGDYIEIERQGVISGGTAHHQDETDRSWLTEAGGVLVRPGDTRIYLKRPDPPVQTDVGAAGAVTMRVGGEQRRAIRKAEGWVTITPAGHAAYASDLDVVNFVPDARDAAISR